MDDNNNGNTNDNTNTNSRFAAVKAAAKSFANKTADVAVSVKNGIVKKKNEIVTQNNERKLVAAEKKKQSELDKMALIFEDDLTADNFRHQRVIRIVNYDKRHDNELCEGSVGFYEKTPTRAIPTIYTKYVEKLGFSFYPHLSESVYIADPCVFGNYIEIDEYFNHMKQVRVNELTLIAQSLGAKHVEIRLRSANKNSSYENCNGNINVPYVDIEAHRKQQKESQRAIEIWASTDFEPGFWLGGPTMPNVLYFRNESDISTLIQMTMTNRSKVTKRTYSMRASSSSGMSLSEAASINDSLKSIKANAGLTFEKRANDESEAVLEYTIEF